ncbi:MAG: hypothetical protein DRR06_06305 [Gammaproteobacteria bacterium]|nr:MAG: hypothetical protein DRR06_06305 [Gammaproteobacteria bacterium]
MSIDRPDVFFRSIHPKENTVGNVILERYFPNAGLRQSHISLNKLASIASQAYLVPDIFFSVARFNGQRLLLNFEQTSAVYVQIPVNADPEYIIKVYNLLDKYFIPLPTSIIDDGSLLTLFWVLKNPLYRHEFYKVYLLHKAISRILAIYNNSITGHLSVDFITRLIGTINSQNNKTVSLLRHTGRVLSNEQLENVLLKQFGADEYQKLQKHATIIQELLALFSDRFWTNSGRPELFEEWLIYFGASMSYFCEPKQLKKEMIALAESLEAYPWIKIKHQYDDLTTTIAENSRGGYLNHKGVRLVLNGDNWLDIISNRLNITQSEVDTLGLYILGRINYRNPSFQPALQKVHTIGSNQFVATEVLLMKQA